MRADLESLNAVQLEDAKCGCERWEIDGEIVNGPKTRSTVCLHDENCTHVTVAPSPPVPKARAKK